MLNANAEKLLTIVLKECGSDYKILTEEDFSSVSEYAEVLDVLDGAGYINVKYSGNGDYLVAPTYKARAYFSEKEKDFYLRAVLCRKVGLYAFVGALMGGLAAILVALALRGLCAF